jgi:hypothetical protein
VFALFSIVGCVSSQPKPGQVMAVAEKGSVVYIYRPNSFSNVVISPSVFIDGKERFLISNDKYTFVHVSPGKHAIKLNLENHYRGNFELMLNVKPNQAYFVRVDTSMKFVQSQPYIRSFSLNAVIDEVGLADIKECKYMKPEMPSKYLFKKSQPGQEPRFTTDKTSDPFSRNKFEK